MNLPIGNLRGLTSSVKGIIGPWKCEQCGHITQYADVQKDVNRVFCRFHNCDYWRIIDKVHFRIVENDGTMWEYDPDTSSKRQITPV